MGVMPFVFLAIANLFMAALVESLPIFQSIGSYVQLLFGAFICLALWAFMEAMILGVTFREERRFRKKIAPDEARDKFRERTVVGSFAQRRLEERERLKDFQRRLGRDD